MLGTELGHRRLPAAGALPSAPRACLAWDLWSVGRLDELNKCAGRREVSVTSLRKRAVIIGRSISGEPGWIARNIMALDNAEVWPVRLVRDR